MFRNFVRTIKNYWGIVLQDINGAPSSKRWTLLVSILLIIIAFVANLVWRIVVDSHILDAIKWLGGASTAGIATEYLPKSSPSNVVTQTNTDKPKAND